MKLITFDEITKLNIDPKKCYEWVCEILRNKHNCTLPPKVSMHPKDGEFCNIMPCIVPKSDGTKIGGVKVVSRYLDREPSLDSKLLLMDMDNGDTLALMDANWITAMRTGAICAHSVLKLAKSNFETVAIMGLGNTARASLLVLASLLEDRQLKIKLLRYKNQEVGFVERFKEFSNLSFSFVDDYESLIKGSDVVISCVSYTEGDFASDDCFEKGILLVPVHTRGFTNCDLFFDKIYADDYGHVCHFKNFAKFKKFAEMCDVETGEVPGRENDDERIIAYNIGLSIHDISFAGHIYEMLKDKESIQEFTMNEPTGKFWI